MSEDFEIVVLAAGKGKRMLQPRLPKVLVPLAGKPIIAHLLGEVRKIKSDPILVLGYKSALVKKVLGSGYKYAYQRRQLGTAHALLCAKPKIKSARVLVLYGDMPLISAKSIAKILKRHKNSGHKLMMFSSAVPHFSGKYQTFYGFARILRKRGKIQGIRESRDADQQQLRIREINPGIYVFDSRWLWQAIKSVKNENQQGEYYLTDLVAMACKENSGVGTDRLPLKELWGINNSADLQAVERFLQKS